MHPVSWPIMTSDFASSIGNLDFPIDGERARKFPFRYDVAKSKSATIIPGRIVDDLRAERLDNPGRDSNALTIQDVIIIDHILWHHLVDMTGRVDRRPDI